jgi:hypothetical protein
MDELVHDRTSCLQMASKAKLQQLQPGKGPADPTPAIQELLETTIPRFQRALQEKQKDVQVAPPALE